MRGGAESGAPEKGALATAGPRCTGGTCSCRAVDDYGRPAESGNEGTVALGKKRFEIRTGRGHDKMTITIDGAGTLVKDNSKVDPTCGYIELNPGLHAVRMRVEATDVVQGIHPRLVVNEYGRETADWYSTFQFGCGTTSPCMKDDMQQWMDNTVRASDRGIYDKCGSARIENVRWSVEHSPERTLEDLTLEFVLHVYKFEPRFAHGVPTCKGIGGGKGAEEEIRQGGGAQ
jgi:hypothetical protein